MTGKHPEYVEYYPETDDDRREPNAAGGAYLFASWLTTRDDVVSFGKDTECAQVAELLDEYRKRQGWDAPYLCPDPRERMVCDE